ncbi:NERD domain-containing protein [Streptomyces sp. MUM 203J]|uniref:NERD domain-containing protein n=1 Tax=Streptomyces sp. MUM 203J TaxID=2791990 RepID=UPI001F037A7E|nr:NERD domain-containing protein [Streptomyces sp. MUM 203J]MCH0538203.1 NERD domain-containing protein [Streptomyces sp. MUM 203J]
MTALLRVTPTGPDGRERYFVSLRDGRTVAWYEPGRAGGRICLLDEVYATEARAALAPYLTGEVTAGPPPVPTAAELAGMALHPDDDLAPNRPAEDLLTGGRPQPGRERRLKAEVAARERVGEALDLLGAAGWRVLHAVPSPVAGDGIDHLAIGPGGTLAVRTVASARRARVRVGDPQVTVGRGDPRPLLRWVRRDADRAAHALAAAVRPVLAFAHAARVPVPPSLQDVRILRADQIPALAGLSPALKPTEVESLYAIARDRRTWLNT